MAEKKGKKVKMTEAEKREKVALALAKKKEVEARALEIVHREACSGTD
jgi:dsDNA-binding SOS-regulon protein